MKKNIVLALVLSVLVTISCNKMDSTYSQYLEDGNINYTQRVDSVMAYSGRNRVLLTWDPINDPRVNMVKISWSPEIPAVEVPITSPDDTLSYIEGLTEGNYTFNLQSYGQEGNHSVKTEVVGFVYDKVYESGLILRSVSNMSVVGTTLNLTFRSIEGVSGYHAQEVVYTSAVDGQEKTATLEGAESELTITDFSGETFTHRSVYLPQTLSPDFFYSPTQLLDINGDLSALEYTNPVFLPILADPTVIRDPETGFFYAYGTEDRWYTANNVDRLVPILRSKDLVNWTYVRDAFTSKPSWKTLGGIWAPDIAIVNGKYHLYYAYSTWGDTDPGIGVATSNYPGSSAFNDQGRLFLSSEIKVPNSIDPFYYEEDGKKYLFWGSFSSEADQGTYGAELSDDGLRVRDMNEKFKIAAGDWEAVNIHKRAGYYYFFGSKGSCCNGINSTYHIRVGRSTSLQGPYLDRDGNDIAERGNGTLVLQGNAKYIGPGHNARIITDKNGNDWMLYHAMDVNKTMVDDVNQRALFLDRVNWDSDGWPMINDGTPSTTAKPQPVF